MTVNGFRYIMEKVDLVIVGAEGVVESGGIINKVSFACVYTNTLFLFLVLLHSVKTKVSDT